VLATVLTPIKASDEKVNLQYIEIAKGTVSGANTFKLSQGSKVLLNVRADETLSLHLHGYNLYLDTLAGKEVRWQFSAHTAGRFAVSIHEKGSKRHESHTLFYLEIYPQ